MRKRSLTRFQLVALLVVTGLVLYRVFSGPPAPRGTVTINKIDPGELRDVSFRLDDEVPFAVSAVGSFASESETNAEGLAVYGWIVDRQSGRVVWKMHDSSLRADRTLASAADSLSLPPGLYTMYFASYGNLINYDGRGRILGVAFGDDWIADADNWHLILNLVNADDAEHVSVLSRRENPDVENPLEFWSTGPVESKGVKQHIFEVMSPVQLELYSTGEYCSKGCDFSGIVDYATNDTLWQLSLIGSESAGGLQENITFKGRVDLKPGTYRAFYQSDKEHGYGHWQANPPYDPTSWGLSISFIEERDNRKVAAFDPWTQRQPLISITRLGSDQNQRVPFEVADTVSVLIYGVGELTDGGSRYDYATLKDVATGDKVWEMLYEDSEPAGGSDTNRKVSKVMDLFPGRYELTFQTDGSHDFPEFSNGEPYYPDRWGVTMFAFSQTAGDESIVVHDSPMQVERPADPQLEFDTGEVIVSATQLGNESSITKLLVLDNLTIVRIVAVGEITAGDQYDYGWIDRNETGEVVWEMTRLNTQHAGGDDHNRKYEGLLELPAGTYTVHFKTDFSHAFGDFDNGGPENPSEWGIRIEKILSNE